MDHREAIANDVRIAPQLHLIEQPRTEQQVGANREPKRPGNDSSPAPPRRKTGRDWLAG